MQYISPPEKRIVFMELDSPATWYVTFFVASGPWSEGLQAIVSGPQSDDALLESGRITILELQTDTLFTAGPM